MNAFLVYDNRYTKTKIRLYGDKVYTNFPSLNMSEDDVKCESFASISIDSLIVYGNKSYLQVYSGNRAYKIVNAQMIDYLGDNLFESDKN